MYEMYKLDFSLLFPSFFLLSFLPSLLPRPYSWQPLLIEYTPSVHKWHGRAYPTKGKTGLLPQNRFTCRISLIRQPDNYEQCLICLVDLFFFSSQGFRLITHPERQRTIASVNFTCLSLPNSPSWVFSIINMTHLLNTPFALEELILIDPILDTLGPVVANWHNVVQQELPSDSSSSTMQPCTRRMATK